MPVIPIIQVPDPRLTQKSAKVKEINEELKQDVQNLLDTLNVAKNPEGAGIAAPQLGIMKKVCIVRQFFDDPNDRSQQIHQDFILINPKIVSTSTETDIDWEGCLSVPDKYGQVVRYSKVKITATDLAGNMFKMKADGLLARVIQHEIDHLDGILFTERVVGKMLTETELDQLFNEQK
jgi:peptide deformylase